MFPWLPALISPADEGIADVLHEIQDLNSLIVSDSICHHQDKFCCACRLVQSTSPVSERLENRDGVVCVVRDALWVQPPAICILH